MNEREFALSVEKLGGRSFVVGGFVRDKLLGKTAKDKDYVVTGISLENVPWEIPVGHDAPVFLVEIDGQSCEVALARKEKKNGVGYHGFTFFSDEHVTIEQDLFRRDLTINAMAIEILTGELFDPFNGQGDLRKGLLRHVSPAFAEDPLRVFRVARFAARFGFGIHPETLAMMESLREEVKNLKAERVWLELEKALSETFPDRFFEVLDSCGLLDHWFPEIANLHVRDMHDGTAFRHVMNVLSGSGDFKIRFGLLCHDFGKAETDPERHPHHFGHDALGVPCVEEFCRRLRIPNELREFAKKCSSEHMKVKRLGEMKPAKVVRWVLENKKFLGDLLLVSRLDSCCRSGADVLKEEQLHDSCENRVKLVLEAEKSVTGKSLVAEGVKPGPALGQKLFERRVSCFRKLGG